MAMKNFKQFLFALCAAVFFGLACIVFVLIWVLHYEEGLIWDGGKAEFDLHPFLTVFGFIFFQGIAIIVYRLPWTWQSSKLVMKFIHAGLNLIAMILAILSLVAVFQFHDENNHTNMYSLHGWVGVVAVALYCLQIVLGVGMYLIPITPVAFRAAFMPIHVYCGHFLFTTVIAVALMGITEKLGGLSNPGYNDFPPVAIFVNVLGLLLVIFGALILWIATRPYWKRPSDQIMHPLHTNGVQVGPTLSQLSDGTNAEANGDVRKRSYKLDGQDN